MSDISKCNEQIVRINKCIINEISRLTILQMQCFGQIHFGHLHVAINFCLYNEQMTRINKCTTNEIFRLNKGQRRICIFYLNLYEVLVFIYPFFTLTLPSFFFFTFGTTWSWKNNKDENTIQKIAGVGGSANISNWKFSFSY